MQLRESVSQNHARSPTAQLHLKAGGACSHQSLRLVRLVRLSGCSDKSLASLAHARSTWCRSDVVHTSTRVSCSANGMGLETIVSGIVSPAAGRCVSEFRLRWARRPRRASDKFVEEVFFPVCGGHGCEWIYSFGWMYEMKRNEVNPDCW